MKGRFVLFSLMLTLVAGCTSDAESDALLEDEPVDLTWQYPIARGGQYTFADQQEPPKDASPFCQFSIAGADHDVEDFSATVEWTASSDRTDALRLEFHGPRGQFSVVEGGSPLTIESNTFQVFRNESFGFVVGLARSEPTDELLLQRQSVEFANRFLMSSTAGPFDLGQWSFDCPNAAQ